MEALARARLEPELLVTLPRGETVPRLAERLEREDVARVVYLGGDGTFAEAAKGIILARERTGIDLPLGMLPMGTANDQGRSFGIPAGDRYLESNVATIAAGTERWLDVGRIQACDEGGEVLASDLFFDGCGFGLSAQILAGRNRDRALVDRLPVVRRFYRGRAVYTGAAVRSLLRRTLEDVRCSVVLTLDRRTHEYIRVTDLLVQGTMLYAGSWIFDPESRPDDGQFEVVVLCGSADWARAAIGRHQGNPVTRDDLEYLGFSRRPVLRGQNLELRILRPAGCAPLHAQIDGEEFRSADNYRISNLFHHLRILVPEHGRRI
jgi:diacylglycerol kinase family enzyme